MGNRYDKVLFQAVANSIDISAYVKECAISFDLSRRISECTLSLYQWPTGVQYWDTLDVYAGLEDVDDYTNGLLQRFTGYVWDPELELWPEGNTMLGRGPLILAERQKVPSDEELDQIITPPLSVDYGAPGIDLSVDPDTGEAWHDYDMITHVLGLCNLTDKLGTIGGNPHLLGTQAFDQFCWRRQESGLSFCEKLDAISLGFRTYDMIPCSAADASKTVYRTRLSMLPDVVTVKATLTDGIDMLAGTRLARAPSLIKNCVRVEGWNPGNYPQVWVSIWPHPVPPPGVTNPLDTEYFSSSLIENQTVDWSSGMSAKEWADWRCHELSHDWWQMTVETWRDFAVGAGESVYVISEKLAGDLTCNQAFWVQAVDIKVSPNAKFRQTLRLRAPAYWAGAGSFLGNLQLGSALNG